MKAKLSLFRAYVESTYEALQKKKKQNQKLCFHTRDQL